MKKVSFLTLTFALSFGTVWATSADYYMKIEGVEGESSASSETRAQFEVQRTGGGNDSGERSSNTSTRADARAEGIDDAEKKQGAIDVNGNVEVGTKAIGTGIEPDEIDVAIDPEAKKGKVEASWKVEEGTKAAEAGTEPDELNAINGQVADLSILLGGSDDYETEERWRRGVRVAARDIKGFTESERAQFLAAVQAHAQVESGRGLENFARGIIVENESVEEVHLNFEKLEVKYRTRGKVLGLIPVSFTERVEVETEPEQGARVKVKAPWYSFLLVREVRAEELEADIRADIEANLGGNLNWDFGTRAYALARVSNVLKARHDTAKNSIRNVR